MLSRIEIKEELERFIEWPTDDHGSVSATSTALFAHHVQQKATEKLRAELERVTSELEQYKRDAERLREAIESIRSMTNADDPESYRSDDMEGCLDAVFGAAEQALSAQPAHRAKLEMAKPECACRVESDDKFGSLIYKCPQHDNSVEGQQAEVKS